MQWVRETSHRRKKHMCLTQWYSSFLFTILMKGFFPKHSMQNLIVRVWKNLIWKISVSFLAKMRSMAMRFRFKRIHSDIRINCTCTYIFPIHISYVIWKSFCKLYFLKGAYTSKQQNRRRIQHFSRQVFKRYENVLYIA